LSTSFYIISLKLKHKVFLDIRVSSIFLGTILLRMVSALRTCFSAFSKFNGRKIGQLATVSTVSPESAAQLQKFPSQINPRVDSFGR
jgi:hypothetical protein